MGRMTDDGGKDQILEGRWSTEDAARLYGLEDWGKGYFAVNAKGHLAVRPTKTPGREIDLHDLTLGLRARGVHSPVLVRLPELTRHRLEEIRTAFDTAIEDESYGGRYRCVYPIKVNQQRHVCEEIRDLGAELGFGLEAGSKPELLAVLGLTVGQDQMPIVCNGFKDDAFIETVILATKLGRNVIPVVEKESELDLVIRHARAYGVTPKIGLRAKLSSRGAGRWESSAGVRSKFGLTTFEILRSLERLRTAEMVDSLVMLHCHIGSQVADIRSFKNAVNELAHIYTELRRLGAPMTTIDIGGGLGVDYDGSQSRYGSSINYTVREYATDVVYRIKNACDDAKVPHPDIISESGRAMVAYSSMLVVDVLGTTRLDYKPDLTRIKSLIKKEEDEEGEDELPQPVLDLLDAYESLDDRNVFESLHDALAARDEALSLFGLGYMSLPMRSCAEELFWGVGRRALEWAQRRGGELPGEFQNLPEILSDIYFCNFSIFQSLPDHWAIDQVFPVVPLHRLDEEPRRRGILADITCDSDGQIDLFVGKRNEKKSLELHRPRKGEPYYLGVFLLGAYQEILGDLHNLFGDTHAVHVTTEEGGGFSIDEVIEGDAVRDVLGYVQFDTVELQKLMRRNVEGAVKEKRLTVEEGKSLLKFYERGLSSYTYLEE